jgi:hypothetical protein
MKTQENMEWEPDDPESTDAGNIQMEYLFDWVYNLKYRSSNKKLPIRT